MSITLEKPVLDAHKDQRIIVEAIIMTKELST